MILLKLTFKSKTITNQTNSKVINNITKISKFLQTKKSMIIIKNNMNENPTTTYINKSFYILKDLYYINV
jgi:hypothetical protein